MEKDKKQKIRILILSILGVLLGLAIGFAAVYLFKYLGTVALTALDVIRTYVTSMALGGLLGILVSIRLI
jgi:hypothetical protein